MINTTSFISALALASAVVASPFQLVAPRQLDQPIIFNGLSYEGAGCPAGSITTGELDFENWQFEIFYAKLAASIEPNAPKVNLKCQIALEFSTTTAQQIVVFGGDYRGLVNITEGVYAKQQNQYKFKGNEGVTNMQWEFKGPLAVETTYANTMNTSLSSSCQSAGANFTMIINNYLTLTSEDGGSGSIAVSGLSDAGIMQSIKFNSTAC